MPHPCGKQFDEHYPAFVSLQPTSKYNKCSFGHPPFLKKHHLKQNAGKTMDEVVCEATAGSSVSGRGHGWPSDTGGVNSLIRRVFPHTLRESLWAFDFIQPFNITLFICYRIKPI
ncbi:hypothetical protein [Zooshikella harenae]|uniref:Uncharacterized protein n=1 Tax=Zooshikella harenae TaxID=2827238 RepID=A0ABS5ZDK1_9GAMM|nr:hypothetical protein [Zooshikella harenae]MBU2712045.1 hypothetical protein [Zooshikella harenae]